MLKKSFLLILSFVILLPVVETASAGVLLRSSRVRARVRTYTPRVSLQTNTKRSTAVARSIRPLRSTDTIGTVEDSFKLVKAQEKYQKKYNRWEKKRDRKIEKRRRKALREREKEQARLARQQQIELRKRQKAAKSTSVAKKSGDGRAEVRKPKREGILFGGDSSDENGVKKPSFWTRLKRAIFGRKSG